MQMNLTPRMAISGGAVALVVIGAAAGWLTAHFASPSPQRSEIENIVKDYVASHPQAPQNVSNQRPEIEKIVKDYLQANPQSQKDVPEQRAEIEKTVKDYLLANPQLPQDINRETIVNVMKDYLMTNPQFLQDVITELDKKQKEASAEKARTNIKANNATIFNSPHEVVLGNPNGNVTMVEFFDYNCGYCKHALPDMMKLLQSDPNLRFVLKEFPVLGEGSVEAAHVAVAARMQDPTGAKYIEFHQKLLGGRGAADKVRALAVAKEVGFDMGRLMKDMDSDEVKTTIAENLKLADTLGVDGTPSYVVGDELVVGAVGYDELEKKINALRK
jgi:protein-disulfide isomerase